MEPSAHNHDDTPNDRRYIRKSSDEADTSPAALSCNNGGLHAVARGETFRSIAAMHGTTVLDLSERNPYADPEALLVGEVLCVPEGCAGGPHPPDASCPFGYAAGTIRYGQTYEDLLLEYNVSYLAFRLSNPNLDPDRLLPGQKYCIPPTGSRGLCGAGGRTYIMLQGDTLMMVAARFHTTPGRLLRLNQYLAPADFVAGRVICVTTA